MTAKDEIAKAEPVVVRNYAFIDGQNLHLGTTGAEEPWVINLDRFRVYLQEKYSVEKAFYYLGYIKEGEDIERLYEHIQSAGFVLVFRQHNSAMLGKKKGNVDSDIIFNVMRRMYDREDFDNVVLVSGDGDYKMLVDFLIAENRFEKILFPNTKYRSSLYKKISATYYASLDDADTKKKIEKS
jgi:uncharacterized LabA/DUF88 family protein